MRYALLFAIAIALSVTAAAQDAMSTHTTLPVTIDGRADEWPQFFRFYAPGTRFQFDVMNDSVNLYACVRVTEMDAQARLMHAGVTIWLDPSGKKKQKSGVNFPIRLEHGAGEGPLGEDPSAGSASSLHSRANRLRSRVIMSQAAIRPIELAGMPATQLPLDNANGLRVAFAWDSLDILYVEYQIPLALVLGHTPTAADLDHPLGFGLVSGAVDNPDHHKGGDPGAGMSNMGGGSRGGGGAGGRPGGMTGQGQTMSGTAYDPNKAEQKTWLKLHLETAPVK